jgi:hypothetical protein
MFKKKIEPCRAVVSPEQIHVGPEFLWKHCYDYDVLNSNNWKLSGKDNEPLLEYVLIRQGFICLWISWDIVYSVPSITL